MKIDIRSPKSVYITIGNKTFYIDDSTDEAIMELLSPFGHELHMKKILKEQTYCRNCGSKLGLDCGEAEPDYNHEYCSLGCYHEDHIGYDPELNKELHSQLN